MAELFLLPRLSRRPNHSWLAFSFNTYFRPFDTCVVYRRNAEPTESSISGTRPNMAVALTRSMEAEVRVRLGFDNGVFRFLQALEVATGAWDINQLPAVGALTR